MNDVEALGRAARLQAMGITIKSPELAAISQSHAAFAERGGNRAMRRAAKRAARRKAR